MSKPLSLCVNDQNDSMGMTLQERLHAVCKNDSPILKIVSIQSSEILASVSASNSTRQFALSKTLLYQLSDKKEKKISNVRHIRVQKPLVIDNNIMLSGNEQRNYINEVMTRDLYILLRLRLYSELKTLYRS